jgi:hypothetical protein
MFMETFPVALFVYKRPEHTARMLQALSQNTLAGQSDVIIFSDGPKTPADAVQVAKVRDLAHDASGFKSVRMVASEKNRGLAKSIIAGVTEVLRDHDAVIVLEDDLVSSSDFLTYMNAALAFYRDKKNVYSVAGFAPGITLPSSYQYDSYLIPTRGCSWGWGTWKQVWDAVDWEVSDYKDFIVNRSSVKKFNQMGNDMIRMLSRQMEGDLNSWSIRFDYHHFKNDALAAYPVKSKILNEGMDGSGENSAMTGYYSVQLADEGKTAYSFATDVDEKILKINRAYYNKSLGFWNKLLMKFRKYGIL